jgi:hypothetical protein
VTRAQDTPVAPAAKRVTSRRVARARWRRGDRVSRASPKWTTKMDRSRIGDTRSTLVFSVISRAIAHTVRSVATKMKNRREEAQREPAPRIVSIYTTGRCLIAALGDRFFGQSVQSCRSL